ncbi:MAG: 23S rRNA (pseudouridine(1915)-N(3))-methyltransferase RlmH [Firmicutes bacterium]|nr:23S rRNA (pseudouridine(1915)-N(3))-methyltransferase RlmH [Bacillota bacterium]
MAAMRLLTVGKPRNVHIGALAHEYYQRLGRGFNLTWDAVSEEPLSKGNGQHVIEKEGQRLLARIGRDEWVVLLDVEGELVSSSVLAQHVERWRQRGTPLVIIIGGPLGVDSRVRERADWRWSLSPLTFPHEVVPLLVLEQLYRAWSILEHHPYHK